MSRLVIVLCLMFAVPALAHTHLLSSVPADKAELAAAPKEAVLRFAEPVTLTSLKLQSSDGTKTVLSPLPESAIKEAHVPLPALKPARYTVQWRATSDDGHVINGEFSFVIK